MRLETALIAVHALIKRGSMKMTINPLGFIVISAGLVLGTVSHSTAQSLNKSPSQSTTLDISGPPYEKQMIQLAETLGSLQYLSNLCGHKTSLWRDQMNTLLTTEKVDANRRKILISSFNNSYRSYEDNYSQCTDQALKAIARFKTQGEKLSEGLIAHYGN